jgi:hypothetical protein
VRLLSTGIPFQARPGDLVKFLINVFIASLFGAR